MRTSDGSVPAPLPNNESERLQALKSYCVLDSPPEPSFDNLTALASVMFRVPISLVALIDENRQFFKSALGLSIRESPRNSSFCAYSILSDQPLVVLDTHGDDRFRTNPFVTGDPGIRFYAGAPLMGKDGMMLGSFSIIDREPREQFTVAERTALKRFAALAVQAMEHRLYPERIAQVEHEIIEANERYKLVTQATTDGIWEWDCATDMLYHSSRMQEILGLEAIDAHVSRDEWRSRIHPADLSAVSASIERFRATDGSSYQSEYRVRHEDGSWRWILSRGVAVRNPAGDLVRVVGAISDITGPKFIDPLTGLHTRASLMDVLDRRIQDGVQDGRTFALIFVDLDYFKRLNSTLGRGAGDMLLVEFARRLADSLTQDSAGIAARITGDEFAVLLDSIRDENEARRYAEFIQSLLLTPFHIRDQQITMTASIGIVIGAESYTRATDIIQYAEVARHESKNAESTQIQIFTGKMHQDILRRMSLTSDLREALAAEALELHYQPKLDLHSLQVVGFEALARWKHPEHGYIPPNEFIAIAEECDLIQELGQWTLQKSIAQLAAWRAANLLSAGVRVAINLSARQLSDRQLLHSLQMHLERYSMPSSSFDLEVTEGVLIMDTKAAIHILQGLKALGFGLDLDDFGTGYSSLSYIQKFPFDSLKVDRSFIRDMEQSADRATLVRSIIALGHSLNLKVIAEGIEKEEHLSMLKEMGCDYGQGYLFSKPLPPADVETFLHAAAQ